MVIVIILNVVRAVFQTQFQVVQDGLRRADRWSGLFGNTEFGRLVMSPRVEEWRGERQHGIIESWLDGWSSKKYARQTRPVSHLVRGRLGGEDRESSDGEGREVHGWLSTWLRWRWILWFMVAICCDYGWFECKIKREHFRHKETPPLV